MTEPEMNVANFKREKPTVAPTTLTLHLNVNDPDVVSDLSKRPDGPDRDGYALACLRIGVLAMRQASGSLDAANLRNEGERLIGEVEKRLKDHSSNVEKQLQSELTRYFDPTTGHFHERVKDLVAEDGKLATLLSNHIGGDSSTLARQLAQSVGKDSDLMKYLDKDQQNGLIDTITRIAEERLSEQSKKVLSEFDLNEEDSALNRLIKNMKDIEADIDEKFSPDNDNGVIKRLSNALEETRNQIRKDLTLDDESSALSTLHAKLQKQLTELAKGQAEFQTEVQKTLTEFVTRKKERDASSKGGDDFEADCERVLRESCTRLNDLYHATGNETGFIKNRKVGDHVQEIGPDQLGAGIKIVYESKRKNKYDVATALAELDVAKRNRGADVGVMVLAASVVRNDDKLASEYPRTIRRVGNDILVVWDNEDPESEFVLDCATTLAHALAARETAEPSKQAEIDWDQIDKDFESLNRQIEYLDKFIDWCGNILRDANKINERAEKMKKDVVRHADRLRDSINSLR